MCGTPKAQFAPGGGLEPRIFGRSPKTFVLTHRMFGYVYLFFLWQMVPRLWPYQIEFPARTVVHITLGMAIGAILFLKIAIVRFFRRLEPTLVPMLGTSLLVGTVILIGISVPSAFREAALARRAAAAAAFDAQTLTRVGELLAQARLEDEQQRQRLATPESLRVGRDVLRRKCVRCHDLRTALARPRTPENWRSTVRRMADRTTLWDPIEDDEQWQVTAYLIAISPQLQKSAQKMRVEQQQSEQSKQAAAAVAAGSTEPAAFDPAKAKQLFKTKCSQCHSPKLVEMLSPSTEAEVRTLVTRMVGEGLSATEEELEHIIGHLTATYAEESKE